MKNKDTQNVYSYVLRFNKQAVPDRQALEKISWLQETTHMSIQSTIMFMLASVDVSTLYDNILSLTVPEKPEAQEKAEKRQETKPIQKEQDKSETEPILDSMLADIFSDL